MSHNTPIPTRCLTSLAIAVALCCTPLVTVAQDAAQPATPDIGRLLQQVLILGDSPIASTQIQRHYQAYLGKPADPALLDALRQAVAQAHDEAGWGLVSVDTPRMLGNTAVVRVQALLLSRVEVLSGNPPRALDGLDPLAILPALQVGKATNLNAIDAQLRLAQLQPNRRWEIDFQADDQANQLPGAAPTSAFARIPGTSLADGMAAPAEPQAAPRAPRSARSQVNKLVARVLVSEESPWFGRLIVDNAGQAATGVERGRLQVGHADLFGPGRSLDLTALVSLSRPDRQQQAALRYQHPVPQWNTLFTAEASRAQSRTGLVSEFFDVSGSSQSWSLSAKRVLPRAGALEPHAEIGIEPSVHKDVVDFFGTNLGNTVGVAPLSLGLGGTWQSGAWRALGQVRLRTNQGWGPSASAADYQKARQGAKPEWNTLDASVDLRLATGAGQEAVLRLQGQTSEDALVSPAQFRVGGSQAMRGLQEGELGGDAGLAASLEYWWPLPGGQRLGALMDTAGAVRNKALAGEAQSFEATSFGAGWQWQITNKWLLSTTVAHVSAAKNLSVTKPGDVRWHLSLNGSF